MEIVGEVAVEVDGGAGKGFIDMPGNSHTVRDECEC